MTLEKLQAEMIAAMKSKNKLRKETISSMIQARIPYWERDNITINYILGNDFLVKEN